MQASFQTPDFPGEIGISPDLPIDFICQQARQYLDALNQWQRAHLDRDFPVAEWIDHYTRQVDHILCTLYRHFQLEQTTALIAIGGYGRAELFPSSDVDLLLLCADSSAAETMEQFIQSLWALGLDIAQSVRTPAQCREDAKDDPDMLTSLLEARLLCGNRELFAQINILEPPLISPRAFLEIKRDEQRSRDSREEELGRLEPDIKTGPGGLRDIQMIGWITRYCLPDTAIDRLFTPQERDILLRYRTKLWQIRFALHLHTRKQKDRLSFEQQKQLAQIFGYPDGPNNQSIEQFMQSYYRATLRIRRLNRLALKLIDSGLRESRDIQPLDEHFILVNQCLGLRDPQELIRQPWLLWQIFLHLLDNPLIGSISPQLARQLHSDRDLIITEQFRKDPRANKLFLAILNHRGDVNRQLRRMHRYGLLNRYIPAFNHAIGRMQYDLFHEYTVDQHTLRLTHYLDRFKHYHADYPGAQEIMRQLRHPAILYLAALFHDIGKGYPGDHSEVGVDIAHAFLARNCAIDRHDGELLIFLIRNHLKLSTTAQKKDLSDPAVISDFARIFPDSESLDYLYLLTIADISATNRTLWNSWRANLLQTLYRLTKNVLNAVAPSITQQIESLKRRAFELMDSNPVAVGQLWQNLPHAFFLNEAPSIIASKTRALLESPDQDIALHLQNHPPRLFISARTSPDVLFARTTHFLEKNNLNIVEARLYKDYSHQLAMQQYTLADDSDCDDNTIRQLKKTISGNIPPKPLGARLATSSLKYFDTSTTLEFRQEPRMNRTVLELSCKDRHGLLSLISRVLLDQKIHLTHAKIATFGERVEDTFYLTDHHGRSIHQQDALQQLETALRSALE